MGTIRNMDNCSEVAILYSCDLIKKKPSEIAELHTCVIKEFTVHTSLDTVDVYNLLGT